MPRGPEGQTSPEVQDPVDFLLGLDPAAAHATRMRAIDDALAETCISRRKADVELVHAASTWRIYRASASSSNVVAARERAARRLDEAVDTRSALNHKENLFREAWLKEQARCFEHYNAGLCSHPKPRGGL